MTAVGSRPAAVLGAEPTVPIPATHHDLLTRPICGVFTTLLPSGQPQSSLVWVDFDGTCPRVNTTLERSKGRCITRDPRVSLLVVDPDDTSRFLQVRGTVELVLDGAQQHLDELTRQYTAYPRFYGFVHPAEREGLETRVVCRIHPRRVTLDAIHR